eukprot:COSAG01_NODE_5722_length_4075_cov_40.849598_2_plen_199_part_00
MNQQLSEIQGAPAGKSVCCRSPPRCYGSLALGESLTSLMTEHAHSRNVDLYNIYVTAMCTSVGGIPGRGFFCDEEHLDPHTRAARRARPRQLGLRDDDNSAGPRLQVVVAIQSQPQRQLNGLGAAPSPPPEGSPFREPRPGCAGVRWRGLLLWQCAPTSPRCPGRVSCTARPSWRQAREGPRSELLRLPRDRRSLDQY